MYNIYINNIYICIYIFDSIIMLRFGETKLAKKKFYGAKKTNKNLGC